MTLCFFAEGTILEGVTLCLVRREPLPKLFQRDVVGRDNVTGRDNALFASKTGNQLENSLQDFVGVNVIRLPRGESAKKPNGMSDRKALFAKARHRNGSVTRWRVEALAADIAVPSS